MTAASCQTFVVYVGMPRLHYGALVHHIGESVALPSTIRAASIPYGKTLKDVASLNRHRNCLQAHPLVCSRREELAWHPASTSLQSFLCL